MSDKLTPSQQKDLKKLMGGKMEAKGITKKTIYSVLGILVCGALTIVLSITGARFDPTKIMTVAFWVGVAITWGLAIWSMISGERIGDDYSHNNPKGQFRAELKKYDERYQSLDGKSLIAVFPDWLDFYKDELLQKKIKDLLVRDYHIVQLEVLDLDMTELGSLKEPYKKDWRGTRFASKYQGNEEPFVTYFDSLTDSQIKVVKAVKEGKVKIADNHYTYFLSALTKYTTDMWEEAASQQKWKGIKTAASFAARLIVIMMWSVIENGIVPEVYDSPAATMALNIASRLFTITSSTIAGIWIGMKMVDTDTTFLAYKTLILKTCEDDVDAKKFVYESPAARAKRLYEERQKAIQEEEEKRRKEQEEAAKNVVTPEVVKAIPQTPDSVIISH